MKKKLREKLGVIVLALLLVSSGVVSYVSASDDNIGYEFTLQPNYKNVYSDFRWRQTKNVDNKWKVNMTYSAEGKGTIATYWLNRPYLFNTNTRVSNVRDVKQGAGLYYTSAYEGANENNVNLGAENNNDTSQTYKVSGYWDEETN